MRLPLFRNRKFRALTRFNLRKSLTWNQIPTELREEIQLVSLVLPFRTNQYVTEELIDWTKVPRDPIYQLTFPQREMLFPEDFEFLRNLVAGGSSREELASCIQDIQSRMNPHPDGQLSHNVPELKGKLINGVQHKYRETVLFFPSRGQSCHAYCSYCFRWPQFMGQAEDKFKAGNSKQLVSYLRNKRDVTDLLITGGDPLVMKAAILKNYVDPILSEEFDFIQTIRFGTKSLSYWPGRFLYDKDADDLLRYFENIVSAGRHLAVMAHFSHPVELQTDEVRLAIRRIRSTGAEIRMQAPIIKHVNDLAENWAELWREGVKLGMIPYYMFVGRTTGPNHYFRIPIHKSFQIYRSAIRQVSGLARTARGPVMSSFPGKIQVMGVSQVGKEKVFVLQFLQGRDPDWVGKPFFAKFDPKAYWIDNLTPAFGKKHFFFESEQDHLSVATTVA